ncbi:MAG: hypothetical protein LM517_02930 [Nitrosomonas sp.]|nr:hypothetical protein [Nitrosomonas sp.]
MRRFAMLRSGLLLFKMLLVGIWNGGLSDESVGRHGGLESPRDAVSGFVA